VRILQTCNYAVPLALLVILAAGCSDSSSPRPIPAAATVVGKAQLEGTVATVVSPGPAVRVVDAQGRPIRFAEVNFIVTGGGGTVTDSNQYTDADGRATVGGWTLGQTAGPNTMAAQVQGLAPITFFADAAPGPATTLSFLNTPVELADNLPVAPAISVELRDAYGNRATRSTANVTISLNQAPPNTTIGGTTEVQTVGGVATFSAVVIAAPDLASPVVNSITPTIITSGAATRITGQAFGATPAQTMVTLAGLPATISNGGVSELNIIAPAFADECEPTRHALLSISVRVPLFVVRLRASSAGFSNTTSDPISGLKITQTLHPIRTAPQLPLAVGQSHITQSDAESRCIELNASPARYLISVFSTNSNSVASTPFSLRGRASSLLLGSGAPIVSKDFVEQLAVRTQSGSTVYSRSPQEPAPSRPGQETGDAHSRILQANRRILLTTPHPLRGGAALSQAQRSAIAGGFRIGPSWASCTIRRQRALKIASWS
jgi:hypothetical protein